MPCCMVRKDELGRPPRWIRLLLRRTAWSLPNTFTDEMVQNISAWVGKPIYNDPLTREGDLTFKQTHQEFERLTNGGKYHLNAEEYAEANQRTGSSFKEPILNVPCKKQNCGIMHDPAGHITHFMNKISVCIHDKMKGCEWQATVLAIDADVKAKIAEIQLAKKSSPTLEPTRVIERNIRRIRKQKKHCMSRVQSETNVVLAAQFFDQATLLGMEETLARDALREQTSLTEVGDYNLLLAGLKEFQEVLKARKSVEGKRPKSSLEYAFWKAVESRAGGKLDMKGSGKEQTNGKGMNCMQNFNKITTALLGMYPPEHELHHWLVVQVKVWDHLADAIYQVGCFLKSQKKRSPMICDNKLFRLWMSWQCAFPGMKFNKFHGMFCCIRRYVHTYEMTGRISEESNEAFNGTLADIKTRLRCMPTTSARVAVTNARTQNNLKGEILHDRMKLQDAITGKKRGSLKARARNVDDIALSSVDSEYIMFKGVNYLKLKSGNLLPKIWEDLYQWFGSAIAPKDWRDRLANTAPTAFSNEDEARESLTQF